MQPESHPAAVSREQFYGAVREATNTSVTSHGHHPSLHGYTYTAFRHYVRQRALIRALRKLGPSSALDVGCSEGYFMRVIQAALGIDVWGIDIATVSAQRAHGHGFMVAAADATHIPLPDNSFDLVYATEVIEHILDPGVMLAELRRVARRFVVVTTPVSTAADAHDPDYDLSGEGHVNYFDDGTIRSLFGSTADYRSFRNNSTLALLAAGGSRLPAPIRNVFYATDEFVARRFGSPTHRLKPLRNRDWLIVDHVPTVDPPSEPRWVDPLTHGSLRVVGDCLMSDDGSASYPISGGVPDFFATPS